MKVVFWSRTQTVFRKNNKPDFAESKNKTNELKVELNAVILVPMSAPNSQIGFENGTIKVGDLSAFRLELQMSPNVKET